MLLTVANMRDYGLGVTIAPNALADDGLLDLCLAPRHSFLIDVKFAQDMMRSRTDRIPGYINQKVTSVKITRSIPGNIHVDGTPIPAGEEIEISIMPAALKVAVKE
jgi:diacylglycerol kinase family enzyme